ncbi:ComEC/Rec2 family competence protein [Virgibacillus kekensis]|uniref:ComEC/Rec2 family competence protein n=1 Tax=Virgibacillus kekensis TaxID=202261 RepID=A0ABV9DDE4_9BACI
MEKFLRINTAAVLVIVMVIVLPKIHSAADRPEVEVHFIDVGQGDSILIETPTDKSILIDGGPPKAGKTVVSFLKKHGVEKIDLLIATHPDIDHIGGLVEVLKAVEVEKILDSGKLHTTKTYASYVSQILKQQIPVEIAHQNDLIKIDRLLKIRILNASKGSISNNNSSIALRVSFKELDFLLMADIGAKREKILMNKYNLESEIFKVAHHGSDTSTTYDLLRRVSPEIAILTYGRKNDFGHPVERVVKNLNKAGASIYSTAAFGNISIISDGQDYIILNEKNPTDSLKVG